MAKRKSKQEFRPDRASSGVLRKLYITRKQRLALLRWGLHALVLILYSVVQDAVLCRVQIFGACTDLVPCVILVTAVCQSVDTGSVYALAASAFFVFSGSSPGAYVIAYLTALAIFTLIFRHSFLRKSFGSTMLCAGAAALLYRLAVFLTCLATGVSYAGRFPRVLLTWALSLPFLALAYPIVRAIDKIGGESWKE